MSLLLPPVDHPARELFDVRDLVEVCAPGKRHLLPTLAEAKRSAAPLFTAEMPASAVTSIVLRADGRIQLVQFGPKGGRRDLWTFTH
jgi:hypothetical protein